MYISLPVMENEDYFSDPDDRTIAGRILAGNIDMKEVYRLAFEKGLLGHNLL
ncbi:MAG: hypothetical protein K6E53_07005 [Lachnospiraceae bacterium]|nr:hypothetical protein [Lachnospiraceae bacterium]